MEKLVVLGGGPGGYASALRASQLGCQVTLIEEKELGGVCLNEGCIPTKALIKVARFIEEIKKSKRLAIEIKDYRWDWNKIQIRKKQIVERLRQGLNALFKSRKINLIKGKGKIIKPNKIIINEEQEINYEKIILATGSRAFIPPLFNCSSPYLLTSREALALTELPEEISIIGAGVVGCEFAYLFSAMGVSVTLVELEDHILPGADKKCALLLEGFLRKMGIKLYLSTKITNLIPEEKGIQIKLENGKNWFSPLVLVAVGREPVVEAFDTLNLEKEGKVIKVNEYLQTSLEGVYAVGDITAGPQLAHKAIAQGKLVAENIIKGDKKSFLSTIIPSCVYTHPEYASIGKTEETLERENIKFKTITLPIQINGRALCEEEKEGFIKLIYSPYDKKILGVHMLSALATELISLVIPFIQAGATLDVVTSCIYPHPTMSELWGEIVDKALGQSIHSL